MIAIGVCTQLVSAIKIQLQGDQFIGKWKIIFFLFYNSAIKSQVDFGSDISNRLMLVLYLTYKYVTFNNFKA